MAANIAPAGPTLTVWRIGWIMGNVEKREFVQLENVVQGLFRPVLVKCSRYLCDLIESQTSQPPPTIPENFCWLGADRHAHNTILHFVTPTGSPFSRGVHAANLVARMKVAIIDETVGLLFAGEGDANHRPEPQQLSNTYLPSRLEDNPRGPELLDL